MSATIFSKLLRHSHVTAFKRVAILAFSVWGAITSTGRGQDEGNPLKELEWLLGKWTTEVREVEESSHGPSYHEVKSITVSLAKSRDRLEVRYTYINMPRFDERTYFKFVETIHQDGKRWKKNTSWRKRKGYANVAGGKTSGYLEKTAEGTWTGASVGPYLGRTRPRSIRLKRLNQNQFVYNWNGVEFVCTRDESAKP